MNPNLKGFEVELDSLYNSKPRNSEKRPQVKISPVATVRMV